MDFCKYWGFRCIICWLLWTPFYAIPLLSNLATRALAIMLLSYPYLFFFCLFILNRSYPHGGRVSGLLLVSMACAVVCSCYSITSCRFLTLEFESQYGDFDNHFYKLESEGETTAYSVGVGLFTWLRPFDTLDWTNGHCAGYTELQREVILDERFDSLRIIGVLAVVASLSLFLFSLFMSCLAFNNIQRYLLVLCAMIVGGLTGSVFLITRSALCTQVGENSNCSMDQGGLAAVAGVILWVMTGLIGTFFVQPVSPYRKKKNAKERAMDRRETRRKQIQMLRELERMEAENSQQLSAQNSASTSPSRSSPRQGSSLKSTTTNSSQRKSPQSSSSRLPSPTKQSIQPKSPPRRTPSRQSSSGGTQKDRSRIRNEVEAVAKIVQKHRMPENEDVEVAIRSSFPDHENDRVENEETIDIEADMKALERELYLLAKENGGVERAKRTKLSSRASTRWDGGSKRDLVSNDLKEEEDPNDKLPNLLTRDVSTVMKEEEIQDDGLDLYISKTLDKIDSLIDEENPYNDPYWYEI
mgnify:CR=1 FL=1